MTSIQYRMLMGLLAGVVGGIIFTLLVPQGGVILNVGWGALLGGLFAVLLGERVDSAGTALVWGEAYGLFWWAAGALTIFPLLSGQGLLWSLESLRALTPHLLGYLLGYGILVAEGYYLLRGPLSRFMPIQVAEAAAERKSPTVHTITTPQRQAMIVGSLGGLLAAGLVLQLIYEPSFLVQMASFVGQESEVVGQLLFYLIGAAVGLLFGLLFDREINGSGPALIWGLNYGILWWLFGSLTLIPWLAAGGLPQNWPRNIMLDDLLSLSAFILYAIVLSLFYFIANKVWHFLFIDSDPLNRSREGIGIRGVRNILMGIGAGLIGGLLSSTLMLSLGGFTRLATLLNAEASLTGLLTYLLISTLIGLLYGLLFQRQATSYGTSIAWGLTYGILWWYLGTNTLVDILFTAEIDWSLTALLERYPSLITYLLYGTLLGLIFHTLSRRYDSTLSKPSGKTIQTQLTSTAPALWGLVFVLTIMMPILVGGQ